MSRREKFGSNGTALFHARALSRSHASLVVGPLLLACSGSRFEQVIAVGEPLWPEDGESLDEFHTRYVTAVQTLFYRHIASTQSPDHKLEII